MRCSCMLAACCRPSCLLVNVFLCECLLVCPSSSLCRWLLNESALCLPFCYCHLCSQNLCSLAELICFNILGASLAVRCSQLWPLMAPCVQGPSHAFALSET